MIFIWGSKHFSKNLAPIGHYRCENCNNETAFDFVKHSKWFTFFFIPIFPFSSQHYLLCPICQNGYKLDKEAVNKIKTDIGIS